MHQHWSRILMPKEWSIPLEDVTHFPSQVQALTMICFLAEQQGHLWSHNKYIFFFGGRSITIFSKKADTSYTKILKYQMTMAYHCMQAI